MLPHSPITPTNVNHWYIFTKNHHVQLLMDLCCIAYKNCLQKQSSLETKGILPS